MLESGLNKSCGFKTFPSVNKGSEFPSPTVGIWSSLDIVGLELYQVHHTCQIGKISEGIHLTVQGRWWVQLHRKKISANQWRPKYLTVISTLSGLKWKQFENFAPLSFIKSYNFLFSAYKMSYKNPRGAFSECPQYFDLTRRTGSNALVVAANNVGAEGNGQTTYIQTVAFKV